MSPLPVDITPATTRARAAARVLAGASGADKDRALLAVATALGERAGEILRANDEDVARARGCSLHDAVSGEPTFTIRAFLIRNQPVKRL